MEEARCRLLHHAGELEAALKDLQFLAAAGEGNGQEHNGVLALIRCYLCLLKAEQQVRHLAAYFCLKCTLLSSWPLSILQQWRTADL